MIRSIAAITGLLMTALVGGCSDSTAKMTNAVNLTVHAFQTGGATVPAGQKSWPPQPLVGWKITVTGAQGSGVLVETSSPTGLATFRVRPGAYAVRASMTHVCGGVHLVNVKAGLPAFVNIDCPAA